ncbi:MAG: homoserine O-acetyltransferase [Cyanobium sp.]
MAAPVAMAAAAASLRPGGWRPGDPVGQRLFSHPFGAQPLHLESGRSLGPITLAWERWGQLDSRHSNAILLLHGFSGDSHAAGPAGPGHPTAGWWDRLIGAGRAIDTQRFCVICPNVLGGCQGSTGPASPAADGRPYGSRFPLLSIRDMVATERGLADLLGIERWHTVIGGSMGGMRALEWAVGSPQRLERLLLLATTASCSADNLAAHSCQIEAIRQDPHFSGGDHYDQPGGGPRQGLALARALAQQTYLSAAELDRQLTAAGLGPSHRQGGGDPGEAADDGEGDVEAPHVDREGAMAALLERDGRELVQRFDANSYITLTRAMSHHDIGRGRGGLSAALARVTARTHVVSVSSDRLFPPCRQRQLADGLPAGATYTNLISDLGHDGFLEELTQLRPILSQVLG